MLGEFRNLFEFTRRQIERLAKLPDGRAEAIRGKRAHEPRVLRPVTLVDATDELFADLAGEVQIDIGNRGQGLVEKPTQEQSIRDGIDVGESEEIADNRRHRRTAAPAGQHAARRPSRVASHVRRHLAGEIEEVMVDEKEATEAMAVDQAQLFRQPVLRIGTVGRAQRIEFVELCAAQLREGAWRGQAVRAAEVGKGVAQVLGQVE